MNYGPASKYYDLFASNDDIGFYRSLAMHGRQALEFGVGTGRVAIPLARAGVHILGIDRSRYMLDVARQNLARESPSVRKRLTLKLGDMRKFKLKERFQFIYMAAATFEHCITESEQRKCLKNAYDALQNSGLLAFDISQPPRQGQYASWWIDRRRISLGEVVRTIFSRRDPETNVVSVNLFFDLYQSGKMKERFFEYGDARISSRKDVEGLLREVGFEVNSVYGDYDKSSHREESPRALFVAKKP